MADRVTYLTDEQYKDLMAKLEKTQRTKKSENIKSKEWREAVNLKAAIKDAQKRGELLSVERSGMLRLAKKLGFDIEEEIRNIKKISQ